MFRSVFILSRNMESAEPGPSGSGKSFFTKHLVRQYYEQGAHVLLIDTGNSYEGLCNLIHNRTHGEDGIYYTYTEEKPISFNPFFTEDGVFDVEKKDNGPSMNLFRLVVMPRFIGSSEISKWTGFPVRRSTIFMPNDRFHSIRFSLMTGCSTWRKRTASRHCY